MNAQEIADKLNAVVAAVATLSPGNKERDELAAELAEIQDALREFVGELQRACPHRDAESPDGGAWVCVLCGGAVEDPVGAVGRERFH